jgi:hypothetical protein
MIMINDWCGFQVYLYDISMNIIIILIISMLAR